MNSQSGFMVQVVAIVLAVVAIILMVSFGSPLNFSWPIKNQTAAASQSLVEATTSIKIIEVANPVETSWKQVEPSLIKFPGRDSHATYEFNGKLFLTGGLDATGTGPANNPVYEKAKYYNDIWSSDDGENWTLVKAKADFPPLRSMSVVNFKGALYMFGGWGPTVGYKNGIWKSTDGIVWSRIANTSFDEREGQKVIIFNDKLWLIGGVNYFTKKTFNDVWSSSDGVAWRKEVANAPWHSRWDHDVAVFNDQIWLVGGMNFNGVGYGDEWRSEDGKKWTRVTELAPWKKRQGQALVVFKDLMWLIGGIDAKTSEGIGDTWFTKNGVDWQKTEIDGGWSGREDHEVNVFKDKIVITGGMNGNFEWLNDVWVATVPVEKVEVKVDEMVSR
ncbi:MAG: hypothetical protein WCW56_01045 [Candidatus Paceibacterota bacterium]